MKFVVNPCSIALDEDFTCLLTDSMSPSPLYQGATQSSRDLSDPMAVAVAVEKSASKMTKSLAIGSAAPLQPRSLSFSLEAGKGCGGRRGCQIWAGENKSSRHREKVRAQADVQYGWQGLDISAELLHLPKRTGAILLLS